VTAPFLPSASKDCLTTDAREEKAIDVAKASDQLDRLIERRAGERNAVNELQAMYEASARRHRERKRRENGAVWYSQFSALADSHASISREFERRAEALLEEPGRGEGGRR
jgi:hypothetical protein